MKKLLLSTLSFYKSRISPWLPRACRFAPTCSEYAALSIKKYGVPKGLRMAVWRILRCQPLSQGGIDLP